MVESPVEGRLVATNISFKLPCWGLCVFGRRCSTKYHDGECKPRIDEFIEKNVYGEPGKMDLTTGEIKFMTTNPEGKVSINEGIVGIIR